MRSKLYNLVLFVVSHPRTFGRRLRHHTWMLAKEKITFTQKQMVELESWIERCEGESDSSKSDETASATSDGYCSYDSD